MPYLPYNQDDELKKQQGAQQGQQSTAISGDSTTINQAAQNVAAPKPVSGSGSWTNLNTYLDANKDQADQMGNTIADNITQKGNDATSQINSLAAQAPTVAAYDPNAAYAKLDSLTDADKTAYTTQKSTGGYTGPSTLGNVTGYESTQKAQSQASDLANNAKSELGQQQLLKDTYNRPSYTAGQNKLDQVLLQNSAGSKQALEGVANRFSGITDLFNTASSNVGNSINTANQQALANKNSILTGEKNQWDSLVNPIQARADQMNKDNPELINRITADAEDNTLSDETLSLLGLTPGQNIYGSNIKNYVNPNLTQSGLDNAANTQERNRYQQLADLVSDPSRTQITAGGKQITPITFNKGQFDKDIASQKKEYENAYDNYRSAFNINLLPDHPARGGQMMTGNIKNATPRELVDVWIPRIASDSSIPPNFKDVMINGIKASVNKFNEEYKISRTVQKG